MDKNIEITVCDENLYSVLHDNVLDFLEWLEEQVHSIPMEYRGNARIDIDAFEEYGVLETSIKITYSRPKTKSELRNDRIKEKEMKEIEINVLRRRLSELESKR